METDLPNMNLLIVINLKCLNKFVQGRSQRLVGQSRHLQVIYIDNQHIHLTTQESLMQKFILLDFN